MVLMAQKQAAIAILTSTKPTTSLPNSFQKMVLMKMMISLKDFSAEEIIKVVLSGDSVDFHHFLIMMIFSRGDLVLHQLFQLKAVD